MEPVNILMENVLQPSVFQDAVARSLVPASVAASASSAAVKHVGGSDTLFYILMILILLTALGLVTYLIIEHGREQRELQARYVA